MVRYIPHYTSISSWFPSSFLVATIKKLPWDWVRDPVTWHFCFYLLSFSWTVFSFFLALFIHTYISVSVWSCLVAQSPVFLPGKSHGQRSLVGYSPWGYKRIGHTQINYTHTHTYACIYIHLYEYVPIYSFKNCYFQVTLCNGSIKEIASSAFCYWERLNKEEKLLLGPIYRVRFCEREQKTHKITFDLIEYFTHHTDCTFHP